ncbi:MAG: hypothetical protein OXI55_15525 [Gammaproteobacteria bacterium]|nr:hypothetical protein [Gammaproteobacteria bacterium]
MKVLLDVGVSPRVRLALQAALDGAPVESAVYHQWRSLSDAELLAEASGHGFTVLVTTDKRLAEQQRHTDLAILAVDDNRLSSIRAALPDIAKAIRVLAPGDHTLIPTNL